MLETSNAEDHAKKQGIDTTKFRTFVLCTFVLFAIFLLMIVERVGRDCDDFII